MQDDQPNALGDDFYRRLLDVAKLYAMASGRGIDQTGERGWGFELALRLAQEKFPGFSRPAPTKKQLGRPGQKGMQYRLGLAILLALFERKYDERRGARMKVARSFAEDLIKNKSGKKGKRPAQTEIDACTLQIANDLSKLKREEIFLGWCIVGLTGEGFGAEEIIQKMTDAADSGALAYMFTEFSATRSHTK